MPRTQYLERRGSKFYIRLRVPADVADAFGRSFIRESLGSSDWRQARSRLHQRLADYQNRFDELRGNGAANSEPRRLNWADIDRIVESWRNRQLQLVALEPAYQAIDRVISEEEIHDDMQDTAAFLIGLRGGSADAASSVEDQVHMLLLGNGFSERLTETEGPIRAQVSPRANVDTNTPQFAVLRRKVHAGMEAIARARLLKFRGQSVIDAALMPVEVRAVSDQATSVEDLLVQFRREKERLDFGPRKLLAYSVVGTIMEEVFGAHKLIDEITTADCRILVDVLRTIPPNAKKRFDHLTYREAAQYAVEQQIALRKPSTITSDLHAASAIFNWAVNQGLLDKNPMPKGSSPRREMARRDEQRDPFETDELIQIFNSPVFTGVADEATGFEPKGTFNPTPARFWLPLLSLFHGFRLNEIAQLYGDDVKTDGAIPYIAVQGLRRDQRVKNAWSRRNVPIHPVLRNLGFIEFAESCAPDDMLFGLPEDGRGYYSGAYQKWFSRYLTKVGAKRDTTSFHSFRHTFRNATRRARLQTGVVCRLGGWALPAVHELYGNFELDQLEAAISEISYDLDLSRLHPPSAERPAVTH